MLSPSERHPASPRTRQACLLDHLNLRHELGDIAFIHDELHESAFESFRGGVVRFSRDHLYFAISKTRCPGAPSSLLSDASKIICTISGGRQ